MAEQWIRDRIHRRLSTAMDQLLCLVTEFSFAASVPLSESNVVHSGADLIPNGILFNDLKDLSLLLSLDEIMDNNLKCVACFLYFLKIKWIHNGYTKN